MEGKEPTLLDLEVMQWADLASSELADGFVRCSLAQCFSHAAAGYTNLLKLERFTQEVVLGPLSNDDHQDAVIPEQLQRLRESLLKLEGSV
jgi:hypothetical protein